MVLPCWFRRRSRGWARNYGAASETRKTKFAKRTWNVSWNQQLHFLLSCFTLQIGCAGQGSRCGVGSPSEPGPTAADVDSKGVKRTARAIMLKENEIFAFAANELRGVKFFAKSPSPEPAFPPPTCSPRWLLPQLPAWFRSPAKATLRSVIG